MHDQHSGFQIKTSQKTDIDDDRLITEKKYGRQISHQFCQ
jgi:hypothetical protein